MESEIRIRRGNIMEPEGGPAMGETVEVIIAILFIGGLLFLLSWASGRVGYKLGYSFWASVFSFLVIVLAILSLVVLSLKIFVALHKYVGNETLEVIIEVSYIAGTFLVCGLIWGTVAKKLGHSFWVHASAFWVPPITIGLLLAWANPFIFFFAPITLLIPPISLLYLGFRRTMRHAHEDSTSETPPSDSP
jgi:hypothetical protein